MSYVQKLEYIPEGVLIRAFTVDPTIPIPEINGPNRTLGITYASLELLTAEDWHDWIVDRLLLGENYDLPVLREREYDFTPESFFISLLNDDLEENHAPLRRILPNVKTGYKISARAFLDETIDLASRPKSVLIRDYPSARKSLFDLGHQSFSELYNYSAPRIKDSDVKRHLETICKLI